MTRRPVTTDLDGVLNHYPQCWVDYINLESRSEFATKAEALQALGKTRYADLKDRYRRSSFKATLPPRKEAVELLRQLDAAGHRIVVTTTRPFLRYPGLFEMTAAWLRNNGIPHASLERKEPKVFDRLSGLLFHIEDDPEDALAIASLGHKVFLVADAPLPKADPAVSSRIIRGGFSDIEEFARHA
ncbi:MAG: hypothetical protein KGL53_08430 [Elusimicrobia bacterium]|nr:hypothetical protein [Elusimicrobiota bacterium]